MYYKINMSLIWDTRWVCSVGENADPSGLRLHVQIVLRMQIKLTFDP